MRKKSLLAFMAAMTMVFTMATPSLTARAEGLTQIQDASQVKYGVVTDEEKAILKQIFDAEYYLQMNPDLRAVVGDDYEKLFEHFCTLGVFESRACNPNFEPAAYASAYPDLRESFGLDVLQYYKHYVTVGAKENRTITTLEACANAGITVTSLCKEEFKITPQAYKIAKIMGTNDYATVSTAIESAAKGNEVVISSGSKVAVLSWNSALDKINKLERIGTIKISASDSVDHYVNDSLTIYVDNSSNYAVYAHNNYGGRGVTYDSDTNNSGHTNNDIIVYKTSDSFDENNKTEVAHAHYRVSTPIIAKSLINGQMPTGGVDAGIYGSIADDASGAESNISTHPLYTAQYNDGIGSSYNDPNGTINTEYTLGIDIRAGENGTTNATLAIYNKADKYADFTEITINHEFNDATEAEASNTSNNSSGNANDGE